MKKKKQKRTEKNEKNSKQTNKTKKNRKKRKKTNGAMRTLRGLRGPLRTNVSGNVGPLRTLRCVPSVAKKKKQPATLARCVLSVAPGRRPTRF